MAEREKRLGHSLSGCRKKIQKTLLLTEALAVKRSTGGGKMSRGTGQPRVVLGENTLDKNQKREI